MYRRFESKKVLIGNSEGNKDTKNDNRKRRLVDSKKNTDEVEWRDDSNAACKIR